MTPYQKWILENANRFGLTSLAKMGQSAHLSMSEMIRRGYPDAPTGKASPEPEVQAEPHPVTREEMIRRHYPDGPAAPVKSTMEPEYAKMYGLEAFPEVSEMDMSKPLPEAAKKKKEEKK